jgi:hypothetical protein
LFQKFYPTPSNHTTTTPRPHKIFRSAPKTSTLEDEEAGAGKEEEKRNRAKETRTEMKKNKPAPIWTRWCGGLTASSSNHRHVYIVKRKIWIWERWKAGLRFSERG